MHQPLHLSTELNILPNNWNTAQWDVAHNIDLAEGDAKNPAPPLESKWIMDKKSLKFFDWAKSSTEFFFQKGGCSMLITRFAAST